MHFTRSLFALLSATVAFAADNAFIVPTSGLSATAGQPLQLSWTPTTSGTISLILRSGASSDLAEGTTIASSIANSGNYTWNVPTQIERGSDYTIEIVDDSNPSITNYTPYFVLESSITTAISMSSVTLGAPSSTLATSTPSATTGSSSTGSGTTTAAAAATTSSGSHSSSASASASSSNSGSSTMTTTTSGSSATHASTSASASVATSTGTSGADKLHAAAAGLFGVGALAAFVL